MTTTHYSLATHKFYDQLPDTDERGCLVCDSNDTLLREALVGGGFSEKIYCSDCVFDAHGVEKTVVVLNNAETTAAFAQAQENWMSDVAESRAERAADGL